MIAMYLAREFAQASTTRVGMAFGRDHSTITHCMPVIRRYFTTPAGRVDYAALQQRLRIAAELRELDALSGRVYLAAEVQAEWGEEPASRVKSARHRDHKAEYRRAKARRDAAAWAAVDAGAHV